MTEREKKMIVLAVQSQQPIVIDKAKSKQFVEDSKKRVMDKEYLKKCRELFMLMWERGKKQQ